MMSLKTIIGFLALSLGFVVPMYAQEKSVEPDFGVFATQAEYHQFMGAVKQSAADDPELAAMVPMINDMVLGRPPGETAAKYGLPGNSLDMLSDPEVRKDLEMVDDQYESLQKAQAQLRQQMAEQIRGIDFGSADRSEVLEQLNTIRRSTRSELEQLLLPHQLERLRQRRLRTELNRRSLAEMIASDPIRSEIELTDEQARELKEVEAELARELEKRIEALRKKAREALIESLTSKQEKRVREIFGDDFTALPIAKPALSIAKPKWDKKPITKTKR